MTNKIESIVVQDLDGNAVDLLKKYQNKNLVLIIYNNDCLGCTGRAIPLAHDFQQKYPSIQVIGLHVNFPNREADKESIKSIFTTKEIPFPIYIDEKHLVFDQFNSEGTPQWLIITKNKELYKAIFGSQGNAQNRLFYTLETLIEEN